ncbi:MAG: hypothetical protein B9J98_07730 [Candidatus Terraquivivens tikiterensis]|uniref:DUF5615 domain-containing protein n=1 Tax=Candidatus Terraquivivens tikiterensis TaxID=1980982 RepID=A0A2R7Y0Z7_9ARCH|nr:MAG: hypothetical protein B9J98_07730 [Candidatus Terraquivivens tikiterensis]
MVKFLLDENVPLSVLRLLRVKGYEAWRPRELGLERAKNNTLAKYALDHGMIIITLDEDFFKLSSEKFKDVKIVYIRLHPRRPDIIRQLMEENINEMLQKIKEKQTIILTQHGIE